MFNNQVKPPLAKRIPKITTLHGETRHDDYFWLRDAGNPDVTSYLEAENKYLEQVMLPTYALQETLYHEMLSHIQETDTNVPVQDGSYFYYTRTEKDKQYPIYCRKQAQSRADLDSSLEEILIDFNHLAEGKAFYSVTLIKLSPDHRKLAFLQNETGSDYYTLYVKDLITKADLIEPIETIYLYNSLEWDERGDYLFYVTANEQQRPNKLYRYSFVNQNSTFVYQEVDESYYIYLDKSRSGKFLFATMGSHQTAEIHYLATATPEAAWKVFAPRINGVTYELEHHGNDFIFLCNENAANFKLLSTPINNTSHEQWQELMPHSEQIYLRSIYSFSKHLVIAGRENGLTQLWVRDMTTHQTTCLVWPEALYTVSVGDNHAYDTDKLLMGFQSMLTPHCVLELDLNTRSTTLIKPDNVLNYNSDHYASEQIWATTNDGTKIPISLLYKKGLSHPAPLLLYAYGAYGSSYDPSFNANRLALLDRGVTFAIAHVRGGTEMGWNWYEHGRIAHKKNTFTDFIACAEHLISQGYTTSQQLAAMGLSAGGLLMGAVTTMRPDLFKAVVAKVPFVDVINTMLDPSLPLVTLEYEEWGNPQNISEYQYMKSYSPYDTINAGAHYPHILATAGLNDPRVPYWEPAKWVAKLRANKADQNVLLLKTYMDAGHLGSSGRYGQLQDVALEYAFILTALEF
jgi:oligopeptidase B